MKIWVTRLSTGEIHSGGLERLQVWFTKPVYKYYDTRPVHVQAEEVPWGINPMEGLGIWGWECGREKSIDVKVNVPLSFGDLFGYGDKRGQNYIEGLTDYVWDKLNEHYGNTDFPHGWYEYERLGKCKREDFMLEIELNVQMKIKNKK